MKDKGSISITAILVSILVMAVILAGWALLQHYSADNLVDTRHALARNVKAIEILQDILIALADEPTPGTDNTNDLLWHILPQIEAVQFVKLRVADSSSRIDPNSFQTSYLSSAAFTFLFRYQVSEQAILDIRSFGGYSEDIHSLYSELFTSEAFEEFLSPYSLLNPNISQPSAIEYFIARRTGSEASARRVRQAIEAQYAAGTRFSIAMWSDFARSVLDKNHLEEIEPLFSPLPIWNVYALPEELIQAIAAYPFFERAPAGGSFVQELMQQTQNQDLSTASLQALIAESTQHEATRQVLESFLGVNTWFYEVALEIDAYEYKWILGILPDPELARPQKPYIAREFEPVPVGGVGK